jgi:sporulation protein YlmC with PRC-barrel domain
VDGEGGRCTHLVINPSKDLVTHLVVAQSEDQEIEWLVPFALVAETTPHAIELKCTGEALAAMDCFVERRVLLLHRLTNPVPLGISMVQSYLPEHERLLPQAAVVVADNTVVGRAEEFLVSPADGHITHLVVRPAHLWTHRDVIVPSSEIAHIDRESVYLRLNKGAFEDLSTVPAPR